MDIAARRIPLMIIGILLAILVVQFVANSSDSNLLIDPSTCEIYTQSSPGGAVSKQYTGEFDEKCMQVRELAP